MKTLTQNTEQIKVPGKTNILLLTTTMLICLTAGWLLGSTTTKVFSQSTKQSIASNDGAILLPALASHGEILPTIILREFSVVSYKQ